MIIFCSRIQQEFDDLFSQLVNELKLVTKFHKEYEELNVWLTDTRDILEVTDAPLNPGGMEPPSNPAQLRGKHQVSSKVILVTFLVNYERIEVELNASLKHFKLCALSSVEGV